MNSNRVSDYIYKEANFKVQRGVFKKGEYYDMVEVENFLDDVARKAKEIERENDSLRERNEHLEKQYAMAPSEKNEEEVHKEEMFKNEEVEKLESRLEKEIKEQKSLQSTYKEMIHGATTQADKVVQKAKDEQEKIIEKAKSEADYLLESIKKHEEEKQLEMKEIEKVKNDVKKDLYGIRDFIDRYVNDDHLTSFREKKKHLKYEEVPSASGYNNSEADNE